MAVVPGSGALIAVGGDNHLVGCRPHDVGMSRPLLCDGLVGLAPLLDHAPENVVLRQNRGFKLQVGHRVFRVPLCESLHDGSVLVCVARRRYERVHHHRLVDRTDVRIGRRLRGGQRFLLNCGQGWAG